MSSMKEFMQTFAVNQALKYIEGDPNENLPKLMDLADKFSPDGWYESQCTAIRHAIEDKSNWYQPVLRLYELDPGVRKALFTMDSQNDAEYVGGCIAGGRNYLHINAKGDVEPCVFIHYSSCNIHETSLLDALKSPLFMAYHDNQPFNENMLRPCPMLENPEALRAMVMATGAVNTDYQSPESVDHLYNKTTPYAENWKLTADKLWGDTCANCGNCK